MKSYDCFMNNVKRGMTMDCLRDKLMILNNTTIYVSIKSSVMVFIRIYSLSQTFMEVEDYFF